MRFMFAPIFLILASCAHSETKAPEVRQVSAAEKPRSVAETETAEHHFKSGWENLKEGGREVASGVATGVKKAGTAVQSAACPVAADIRMGVYYAKDSPDYEKMLSAAYSDVRECFASEAGARDKGYTLVR